MENNEGKLGDSDEHKLLEEYKELGLQFRHFASEITSTSRLMLPPMVIGLLILYGNIGKFVGMDINNPTALYWLIWVGCAILSLLWIFNVSRLTQVLNRNSKTLTEGEDTLKLKGHTKITEMDEEPGAPIILRHRHLRFLGFWAYFSSLLNVLERLIPRFIGACTPWVLSLIVVLLSGLLTLWIRKIYFAGLPSLSDYKSHKFKPIDYSIIAILAVLLISYPVTLQTVHDANAYLMRGLKHFAKGDHDKAIDAYTKAIKIKPDDASAYVLRAESHRANKQNGLSDDDWVKANELRKAQ